MIFMKWFVGYVLFLWCICGSIGCSSPEKTMNFFTPDRFGYGLIQGTSTWKGSGDITTIWNSDIGDIYWDVEGEQESSILYLEWDLPQWEDNTAADRYVRERLRAFNLMLDEQQNEEFDATDE